MNTTHILLKFIYIIKNTRQNDIQIGRVYFHQTTLNPPPHTDNYSSTKDLSNFICIHNQSLQNPITRRNHPRIRIPRASPDALVEQKTIQGRGRPLDEPTESGKSRETDEKRLARILTTKESWSEQQKKTLDSGGNLLVAFFQRQKKKLKKKYSNDKY